MPIQLRLLWLAAQLAGGPPSQGPTTHQSHAADLRGAKWNLIAILTDDQGRLGVSCRWKSGCRHRPGVVRPGTVIPELASNVDTYATVLGMPGVARPHGTAPDSRDLSPLMRGDTRAWPDTIFAEYTPDQIGAMQFSRMIRTPRWKLVRNYLNPGGNELYDLEADPDEMRNLYYRDLRGFPLEADSGQSHRIHPHPFAEVLARLQGRLEAWQRRIGDPALDLDARYQRAKTSIRSRWAH